MRNAEAFLASIREHAAGLAKQRSARQRRRNLDPADFDALRVLGLHLATVPVAFGGFWESTAQSLRPLCEAHRILATGDSSVALTASMHPSVLTAWRDATTPNIGAAAWEDQRRQVFQSVVEGAWWGTVNSEPGSGGDLAKTRSVARRDGANYRLTGEKHFGSGSGATSFVQTVAVPDDSSEPAFFFLDVRDAPWDGSTGMKLTAEWDGHGMTSTNSHGFAFDSYPATRVAWPGSWREMVELTGGAGGIIYTSVIVGVVDAAMLYMRNYLIKRGPDTMRSFEKVEWVDAHRETWLLQQALDGALRVFERNGRARHETTLAKTNIAVLADPVLARLCRIAGGGAFSRHSPLGFWFEDVRALGFLRPPWGMAYDSLFAQSWAEGAPVFGDTVS